MPKPPPYRPAGTPATTAMRALARQVEAAIIARRGNVSTWVPLGRLTKGYCVMPSQYATTIDSQATVRVRYVPLDVPNARSVWGADRDRQYDLVQEQALTALTACLTDLDVTYTPPQGDDPPSLVIRNKGVTP